VFQQSKTPEDIEKEDIFFALFDKFQNTSLGDQHQADMLIDEMEKYAEDNDELEEALLWVIDQRIACANHAAAI
jgi:hypothetical protein